MRTVLERVLSYSLPEGPDEFDMQCIITAIDGLQKEGWLDDEIVSYLRWLEHVNPETAEDVALRNMARVRRLVEERKRIQSTVDQTGS